MPTERLVVNAMSGQFKRDVGRAITCSYEEAGTWRRLRLVEAMGAMVSGVDKETIIKLVEVAEAECAEHATLRRNWSVRLAQEADQRWRQRYLRLRTAQLHPWLQQWMGTDCK